MYFIALDRNPEKIYFTKKIFFNVKLKIAISVKEPHVKTPKTNPTVKMEVIEADEDSAIPSLLEVNIKTEIEDPIEENNVFYADDPLETKESPST